MTEWTPFNAGPGEIEDFRALREGVPILVRPSLTAWALNEIKNGGSWSSGPKAREVQAGADVNLGAGTDIIISESRVNSFMDVLADSDFLRMLDWLLYRRFNYGPSSGIALENMLASGRSRYAVGTRNDHPSLVERVALGVQDAAEHVITHGETAGRHLRNAWEALHALEPNAPYAYVCAVKAVESASRKVVLEQNPQATLGTIKTQMVRDADWRVPVVASVHATDQLPLEMLRAIWEGHEGRHGEDDYKDVTYEQARVAVMLAVTLVDLFQAGVVAREPAV